MNKTKKINKPQLWYRYDSDVLRILYPDGRVEFYDTDFGVWFDSVLSRNTAASARAVMLSSKFEFISDL